MAMNIKAYRGQMQWASGLNLLTAIWLFVSAFLIPIHASMKTNNIIVGVVVAVLAAIRLAGAYNQPWMSWLNAILGLWVMGSPWALMGTGPLGPTAGTIANNLITGAVIFMLACWSAAASTTEPVPPATYSGNIRPSYGRE